MYIPYDTIQEIISLVQPHTKTIKARKALVNVAFRETPIEHEIELEGSPRIFASHLVTHLISSEIEIDGAPAINRLLLDLQGYVGENKKHELEILINEIRESHERKNLLTTDQIEYEKRLQEDTHILSEREKELQKWAEQLNKTIEIFEKRTSELNISGKTLAKELNKIRKIRKELEKQTFNRQFPESENTRRNSKVSVARLRWWNPIHWFLLLWWLSFVPEKIKYHQSKYGYKAHKKTGNWLNSTLAWLPLILITIGLTNQPQAVEFWRAQWQWDLPIHGFLFFVVGSYLLLTAFSVLLPDHISGWGGVVAYVTMFILVVILTSGILRTLSSAFMNYGWVYKSIIALIPIVSIIVVGIVANSTALVSALGVTITTSTFMATGINISPIMSETLTIDVRLLLVASVALAIGSIVIFTIVMSIFHSTVEHLKKAINYGTPTTFTRTIFPIVIINYSLIIWVIISTS